MRQIYSLFFLVLSIVLMTGCCAAIKPAEKLTGPQIAEKINGATVALVYTNRHDKVRPFCTGVFIQEKIILTAAHCAAGYAEYLTEQNEDNDNDTVVEPMGLQVSYIVQDEVVDPGKNPLEKHKSFVIFVDEKKDIAILSTYGFYTPEHNTAKLISKRLPVGSDVYITGHPDGQYFTFMRGTIAAYRDDMSGAGMKKVEGPFVMVSTPIYFGNSGGGVFDENGDLVGVASFMSVEAPSQGFFIPAETVKTILLNCHLTYSTSK